jgi:hypothetical protein
MKPELHRTTNTAGTAFAQAGADRASRFKTPPPARAYSSIVAVV